jgi:hypothetical protein
LVERHRARIEEIVQGDRAKANGSVAGEWQAHTP